MPVPAAVHMGKSPTEDTVNVCKNEFLGLQLLCHLCMHYTVDSWHVQTYEWYINATLVSADCIKQLLPASTKTVQEPKL